MYPEEQYKKNSLCHIWVTKPQIGLYLMSGASAHVVSIISRKLEVHIPKFLCGKKLYKNVTLQILKDPNTSSGCGRVTGAWCSVFGRATGAWCSVFGRANGAWCSVCGRATGAWCSVFGRATGAWCSVCGWATGAWCAVFGRATGAWCSVFGRVCWSSVAPACRCWFFCWALTVNFLNIRTPKKFVVIALKFELCGPTIEESKRCR